MMDRFLSLVFCVAALAVCLGGAWLAFPYAALSQEEIAAVRDGREAYEFEDVDLGDFGVVPVLDLVDYYLSNPPVDSTATAADAPVRFQGC